MKEMKAIVEYLVEHKAYSEIKGRKMWMDMASSDVTSRTWQSLKETFLKRILPDIHNPYYKLSTHQIASFKNGNDIEAKLNNKLEIQTINVDSSNEDTEKNGKDELQKDNENIGDVPTGEDLQKLNAITRDSTETLILENCYETAEDIKRDLQSPNEDEEKEEDARPKSLRDLITYSEPVTNLLQNTLDDYGTDEEESNGEPQMQIVENEETTKKDSSKDDDNEIQDSDSGKEANVASNKQVSNKEKENNKTTTKISEKQPGKDQSTDILTDNHVANKTVEEDASDAKALNENNQRKSDITQNSTAITESIPNNQEAFQKKKDDSPEENEVSSTKQNDNKNNNKNNRKRASSQEIPQRKGVKKSHLSLPKQSISDSDAVTKSKNKKKLNPKTIEKKLNQLDEKNEPVNNGFALIVEEKDKNAEQITVNETEKAQDVEMSPEVDNPCLKSVTVYEEELCNQTRDSLNEKNTKKTESKNNKESKLLNDIVILQSHSDSASDSSRNELTPQKKDKKVVTKTREKVMADVFGYSRGVHKNSKRTVSYRKHSTSHKAHRISSGSSEWTSETSSEFISPPRGRKNRHTRKYLKPKSARILSLDEEGGLFVMYGKKIYPVVKDGKIIKNYVTYTPEEEVEHDESFWKLKYVEEKKKADELTKLLKQIKDKKENVVNQVPALNTTENTISNANQPEVHNAIQDKKSLESPVVQSKNDSEDKTVKIRFTKNNEEVQLEGHWSHVNPILTQIMQLLQKESNEPKGIVVKEDKTDSVTESKEKVETKTEINTQQVAVKTNATETNVTNNQDISRQSTPIIPMDVEDEVKEKVNKIEQEIFKEIEERDIEDSSIKTQSSQPEENITKRRGRPRKSSANARAPVSPNKKLKLNPEVIKEDQQKPEANDNSKDKEPETDKKTSEARKTRSPKKSSNEPPMETRTRQSLSRKSKEIKTPNLNESETRYKFPSPPPSRKTKVSKNNKTKVRYLMPEYKVHSSPESRSMCSIDSTQGYQDSDESPLRMLLRRKKRISHTMFSNRGKNIHRYRTNSHPIITDDVTSESSSSYENQRIKTTTFENSTISSEVYRSESYRLLMNTNLTQNRTKINLEKIPESPNIIEQKDVNAQTYGDVSSNVETQSGNKIEGNFKSQTEEYSTSNVSLPTSPVLSIVENMSVSKDLLSSVDDFPISDDFPINDEMQYNDQIILNNFIKTEPDVSMPLMERECAIETSGQNGMEYHYNLSNVKHTPMSETLINKINTVQIQDPTLTDSINNKLKDLIIESTKKNMKINHEVDRNNNIDDVNMDSKGNKRKRSQKRSSTPRKRKSSRRLHLVNNEPCIEEHTESCSYSRKSCPAVVQNVENDLNISQNIDSGKTRSRVKKDIIKVKITKPRTSKVMHKSSSDNDPSIANEANDSESGVFLQCFNETIDLIHNHSETCLNAHDCMGDSVQLLDKTESVISSDSKQSDNSSTNCKHSEDFNALQYDLYSHDAQDGSELLKEKTECSTVFHTPLSGVSDQISLMTEDLSGLSEDKGIKSPNKKVQSSKWYLFSEDETTSSNFFDTNQNSKQAIGCASNLEQIFPITCAVPNLSTITEVSNQNEENAKKCSKAETDPRNNSYSQEMLL
ncbi:unnamed protein product [Danaus chrysippus]|uniref:(African queen) hypothetical protein n=1 Tax=Danaus chrysippus TaxID=151541 RepID=A0A8J2VT75_9NEOP|nr:unnamed protein product [Danaus chrysippus]